MSSSPEENMRGLWRISTDSTDNQHTDYHMALSSCHLHITPLLSATVGVPLPEAWKQSTKWQKIKAEVVPHSHKTFLPTSLHWYCQISPQAFLWFTDDLISSEQIDLVIKRVPEMQSSIKGHLYTQHSIKASSVLYHQLAQSFTYWGLGMNQELDYNSYFSSIRVSRCHLTEIAGMKPPGEGSLQRHYLACKVSWVHR